MKRFAIPVALVLVGAVYLLLTRDTEQPKLPAPAQSRPADSITEVVFSRGKRLFVSDLETGEITSGASLPTTDFDVSPDGELWAATDGVPDKRNPDPNVKPTEIIVGEVDGGDFAPIGIGYSPVWSPDGEDIAAVVPTDGYLICPFDADPEKAQADPAEEGCTEGERVFYYGLEDGDERIALGGGAWEIVGWTGADRIAAYSLETDDVKIGFANATSEQQEETNLVREEILAISPTESMFLTSKGQVAAIVESTGTPIQELDTNIRAAAWSPEGALIAATTRAGAVLLAADGSEQTRLDAVTDPTSTIVWSQDGGHVAFVQRTAEGLEVVVCPSTGSGCTTQRVPGDAELQAIR